MSFGTFSLGRKSQNCLEETLHQSKSCTKTHSFECENNLSNFNCSCRSEQFRFVSFVIWIFVYSQNLPGILGGRGCSTAITRRRFFGSLALACVCE